MNWSNLPSEILFSSLIQLDLRSLLRCSSVCKSWRLNVFDDHLWKHLYHVDFTFDNTMPYENQSWRFLHLRKSKVYKAIQTGNVYIKTLIASHEVHSENRFIGPHISMHKDNVIATCGRQASTNSVKVIGCQAKNIYTEEVSKQLGRSWYSVAIGDYLLSFNVDTYLAVEWHTLKATKISYGDISEIKFAAERNLPWHDGHFKQAIFNADPTVTQVIGVEPRFGNSVLYDWVKNEKIDLSTRIQGPALAFCKNTIVSTTPGVLYIYQDFELVRQLPIDTGVYYAALNDTLLVCSTIQFIWIFDRRNNYAVFKLKYLQNFPLFLFDDLLVFRLKSGLTFYDVSARKTLGSVFYRGSMAKHVIKHSPNEFVVQTDDTVMLLRFDTKPSTISVMHVTEDSKLREITIESTNLLSFAMEVLKSTVDEVHSCYVMKNPKGKRYIMLFKGNANKKAKPNVKANELLQEYFRVASGSVYMPFCPYTTESANITAELQKLVSLDRDFVVTGDVLIFCEQVVNGKSELVKPDKWPTELYTKTVVAENTSRMSDNKKPKKKK